MTSWEAYTAPLGKAFAAIGRQESERGAGIALPTGSVEGREASDREEAHASGQKGQRILEQRRRHSLYRRRKDLSRPGNGRRVSAGVGIRPAESRSALPLAYLFTGWSPLPLCQNSRDAASFGNSSRLTR